MAIKTRGAPAVLGITEQKAKSVPVLLYHGIVEGERDGINKDFFVEHMFILKKNGWNTISLEDFYHFLTGEKELPEKC